MTRLLDAIDQLIDIVVENRFLLADALHAGRRLFKSL